MHNLTNNIWSHDPEPDPDLLPLTKKSTLYILSQYSIIKMGRGRTGEMTELTDTSVFDRREAAKKSYFIASLLCLMIYDKKTYIFHSLMI